MSALTKERIQLSFPLLEGNGQRALQVHGLHTNDWYPLIQTSRRMPFVTSPGIPGYRNPQDNFKLLEIRLAQIGFSPETPYIPYDGPTKGVVPETDKNLIIATVDELKKSKKGLAVVNGHSYGGWLLLEAAIKNPEVFEDVLITVAGSPAAPEVLTDEIPEELTIIGISNPEDTVLAKFAPHFNVPAYRLAQNPGFTENIVVQASHKDLYGATETLVFIAGTQLA